MTSSPAPPRHAHTRASSRPRPARPRPSAPCHAPFRLRPRMSRHAPATRAPGRRSRAPSLAPAVGRGPLLPGLAPCPVAPSSLHTHPHAHRSPGASPRAHRPPPCSLAPTTALTHPPALFITPARSLLPGRVSHAHSSTPTPSFAHFPTHSFPRSLLHPFSLRAAAWRSHISLLGADHTYVLRKPSPTWRPEETRVQQVTLLFQSQAWEPFRRRSMPPGKGPLGGLRA